MCCFIASYWCNVWLVISLFPLFLAMLEQLTLGLWIKYKYNYIYTNNIIHWRSFNCSTSFFKFLYSKWIDNFNVLIHQIDFATFVVIWFLPSFSPLMQKSKNNILSVSIWCLPIMKKVGRQAKSVSTVVTCLMLVSMIFLNWSSMCLRFGESQQRILKNATFVQQTLLESTKPN